MAYSVISFNVLKDRVGWLNTLDSTFAFALEPRNLLSESGRDFKSFHGYVAEKNVQAILPNKAASELEFNEYLYNLRLQSVHEALYSVIDSAPDYDSKFNYDLYISNRLAAFDEVIGLTHGKKILSLLANSLRSNRIERINADVLGFDLSDKSGSLQAALDAAIKAARPVTKIQVLVFGDKIW